MYNFLLLSSILSLLLDDTFCDKTYFNSKTHELFISSNNIRHSKSRLLKQNEHEMNKYLREHEHPVRVIRSESANTTQQMSPLVASSHAHMSHTNNNIPNSGGNITDKTNDGYKVNNTGSLDEVYTNDDNVPNEDNMALVTKFLKIVESQHLTGANCTAGTDLNLGENVVDRYAQERFRVEADVAVNRANMLTRLWKYAATEVVHSEYMMHAGVISMVEFDDDIFAAGNCYDQYQYKDYWLFCPYAYRLPEGPILAKDLAVEYKYLSNTSEWFYIARKNAEKVIKRNRSYARGFNTYTYNESSHTDRLPDEILSVNYEDGKWSKPYYDCGGGNIWMLTYTVPFFGFHSANNSYFFKGTSGIDIDLRRVDIDQCPQPAGRGKLNIFANSHKCKPRTTTCISISGLGFRRGSYKCVCKDGYYFPDVKAHHKYYNGTFLEEEYEKYSMGESSQYNDSARFQCNVCAEGCDTCVDERPCVVTLNWVMRTVLLGICCLVILCLPFIALFTWKYGHVKVVRAASPVLLRVITLGAFLIYCTTIVTYPRPNIVTCTSRVWLREIGFALVYGALMLKTWRISVIFRVRSAKAVKITDLDLLKRLGMILTIFAMALLIRTLVAPPKVIVGRTADNLKAYLCQTDWWDHFFSIMEVIFLIWGIRLCIVVRKAPSEFNEAKFISMAIYNEFLLSVFLNVSMLFLSSPANPDLLYIIFFCHTQLSVTLLLCLIFGSKVYMVIKGHGKSEEALNTAPKLPNAKFLSKSRTETGGSQYCIHSAATSVGTSDNTITKVIVSDKDIQEELKRICNELEYLKEQNIKLGTNTQVVTKIIAMQEAAKFGSNRKSPDKSGNLKIDKIGNNSTSKINKKVMNKITDKITEEEKIECDTNNILLNDLTTNYNNVKNHTEGNVHNSVKAEDTNENHVKSNNIDINHKDSPTPKEKRKRKHSKSKCNCDSKECNCSSQSGDDETSPRQLKSGHSRTRAIVINLDDKNRFTEEVTV
uniref:Probable G-protein coupled receptor CG31760 n=1 Tax=Cacopsylla melanoneura TaxID=428564 RepID=A0A8D8QJJ3_9HEMI